MPLPEAPIKLFLDECIGKPAFDRISSLFNLQPELIALDSIFSQRWMGRPDSEWLDVIAAGGWAVLSADKGRGKRTEKLPILCFERQITQFRLASAVHHLKSADKATFLVAAIRQIEPQMFYPPGRCFSLRLRPNGHPQIVELTTQMRHRQRPPPPKPPPASK